MSNPALKIQLLRKLWAHLTPRETYGIMSPDKIQRSGLQLGDVRRQELSNIHNIERQLSELRRGYLELDEGGRIVKSGQSSDVRDVAYSSIIEFSTESTETVDVTPTLSDMIVNARMLADTDSLGRMLRLQKVYLLTERIILAMNPSEIDKGMVDPRWFSRWRIGVSESPNGAMQQMWARILVRELVKPGSNSMRALDCLASLSLEEAEFVNRLSSMVAGDFVCRSAVIGASENHDTEWLDRLEEIGIIRGGFGKVLTRALRSTSDTEFVLSLTVSDKIVSLSAAQTGLEINLPAFLLTTLGRNVVALFTAPADAAYLELMAADLGARGLTVTFDNVEPEGVIRKVS